MIKSIIVAVIISIAAILWVASGAINKNPTAQGQNQEPTQEAGLSEVEIPSVQIRAMTADILKDTVTVTGRTQAARQVFVSSETSGQIASLSVDKGSIVSQGDVLARLEAKDRAARVAEAEQLIKQRQIQYDAALKLSEQGFTSTVRLAEARAQLETAKTQLKQATIELSNIVIRAPFDGVINDKMIEVGDYVTNGTQLFDLVDLNPIKMTGFLTEKQMVKISQGSAAQVTLVEGNIIDGEVTFIASAADPQTRTFILEITASNEELSIKEGLTAKIEIPTKEVVAYKISPSILSLADDGTVGVKIIDDNNIVQFVPIRLLKDTKEFLWVGGLPDDNVRLITVGQEFVMAGQQVNPMNESTSTP